MNMYLRKHLVLLSYCAVERSRPQASFDSITSVRPSRDGRRRCQVQVSGGALKS